MVVKNHGGQDTCFVQGSGTPLGLRPGEFEDSQTRAHARLQKHRVQNTCVKVLVAISESSAITIRGAGASSYWLGGLHPIVLYLFHL